MKPSCGLCFCSTSASRKPAFLARLPRVGRIHLKTNRPNLPQETAPTSAKLARTVATHCQGNQGVSCLAEVQTEHAEAHYATQYPEVAAKIAKTDQNFQKASLYILRTDGKSCSRELVTGNSKLRFAFPSAQQHLLVWRTRPRSVMVIKKLGDELLPQLQDVVSYLGSEEGMRVILEPAVYAEHFTFSHNPGYLYTFEPGDEHRLSEVVDFVVCLGGDGVLLHASMLFGGSMPPVIAFNLGSLGFLTNHHFNECRTALQAVIYGSQRLEACSVDSYDDGNPGQRANNLGVMVTLRMRLECSIVRRGCSEAQPEQVHEVLNEVVLDRGSSSYLTNVECYEKGRFITRIQADGVMLATPTGSTAYSVSAGGSMVHPNVACILFTPICPHSLNFRPVVLPDYAELELRVPDNARAPAWVCFDGKQRQELLRGDRLFVKMSGNPVPTINQSDLTNDWFDSLERCFGWSNRKEQGAYISAEQDDDAASNGNSNGNGNGKSHHKLSASVSPVAQRLFQDN